MQPSEVSQAIQQFYEAKPYPQRKAGELADPCLEYLRSFSKHNPQRRLRFLDAGCGTGNGAIGAAILYPHFDVYACDFNRVALQQIENEIAPLGLPNFHLRQVDLLDFPDDFGPADGFDIIYSSGVIHHTPDPVGILKTLSQKLTPNGVLRLMVYGRLGREGLYRFARSAEKLFSHITDLDEKLHSAKDLMRELAHTEGRYGQALPSLRGPWADGNSIDEIEFADRYLNPHDKPFDIPSLKEALDEAGLKLLRWVEPAHWDLGKLLPQLAAKGALPREPWEQYDLVDQLFDRPALNLLLVREGFEHRDAKPVGPDTYLGLNSQNELVCRKVGGVSWSFEAKVREGPPVNLSRDEGQLLESIGPRYLTLGELIREMPNKNEEHWIPIVKKLLDMEMLFCPHPPPRLQNPSIKELFGKH